MANLYTDTEVPSTRYVLQGSGHWAWACYLFEPPRCWGAGELIPT